MSHLMKRNADSIDKLLRRSVADNVLPGIVAVIADSAGLVYGNAFGERDTSTGAPVELDSVHGIASFTKLVSAIAVMQLIERGEIDLATPVGDLLPAYDELLVLDGFDDGEPILRPPRRRGNVRNLLSHTSGLAHPTWNAKLYRYLVWAGLSVSELTGTRRVFEMPLVCDPGVEFNYGISGDWVGPLIEAVEGRPFQVVVRENVLEPLDMHDTVVERSVEQLGRSVSVHERDPHGLWIPMAASYYGPGVTVPEVYPAGGCLYSTAVDFLRLQLALLEGGSRDGTRLLRAESVDALFRNQIGSLDVGVLRTEIPTASNDIHLEGWKWGLGMLVNEDVGPDGRSPGSGGWGGGWNTFFWIDRSKGLAAGMYTQTAPFYDPGVIGCYSAFEALASS